MNSPRYNEAPGSGMVADDLGRWVRYAEHKARVDALESECAALAALLAERQGRSVMFWRELARRCVFCN